MREYTIDPTFIPKVFVYDFYVLSAIRRRMLKNGVSTEYKNHFPQTPQQQPPLQCTHIIKISNYNKSLNVTYCFLSTKVVYFYFIIDFKK